MLALTLILIPLIGSLVLLLQSVARFKDNSISSSKNTALIASLATFAVAIYTFITFSPQSTIGVKYSWMKDLNINFHISIDGISLLLVLLTAFLVPLIITSTFKHTYKNHASFYALILLAETALMGVFMARDIFLFYFFYEAALIPVYFIAAIWGGKNAPSITFKMFVYTIFGSLFMLVALVYLYMKGASADIDQLATTAKLLSPNVQNLLFWAFFIAFAIKMPVLPFHTWQPDAYTESPTPATMLLSGLLSKMEFTV